MGLPEIPFVCNDFPHTIDGMTMEIHHTKQRRGYTNVLNASLAEAGAKRFGPGWAWLCQDGDKKLFVCSTSNQDNPLMQLAECHGTPLLGIDVWEHAYYLKYQNKRVEYLQNILKIINWEKAASHLA